MSLASYFEKPEEQQILSDIMEKKVNFQKAIESVETTIFEILKRQWMEEREEIKTKLLSGTCTEEESLELAKQFDSLSKKQPVIKK